MIRQRIVIYKLTLLIWELRYLASNIGSQVEQLLIRLNDV